MNAAEPLSRLDTTGVRMSIGPFSVRLRSDIVGVREYLETVYSDFPMSTETGAHFDIAVVATSGLRRWFRRQANLVVNGARPFLPLPAELSGALFEWSLNWCVGDHAHRWVAVHAAVVERDGQAIVLSGISGAGKSTLCAALVVAGWRLLSDEFALIDPETGLLWPLPRPVSLKNASIAILKQRNPDGVFTPERIDIEGARFVHMKPPQASVRRATEPARAGMIVFPRWASGAETRLEPFPKAHALMRLAHQSFNYNYLGVAGYDAVAGLVGRTDCYTLEYSDLDDVIGRLASTRLR
jgi:HprK-related kinase A